jgi:uncharacterized protein YggU (UPF0235/DUF167 family)
MTGRRASKAAGASSFIITVRAKPRSSVSSLEPESSGAWIARLRASPVEGEANAELIALVAKRFGCPKSAVAIVSGASARLKLVRVSGTTAAQPEVLPNSSL